MRDFPHPQTADLDLPTVLHALSDPTRLTIVAAAATGTAGPEGDGLVCANLDLPVAPATASHHFRVLREAGVTRTTMEGRTKIVALRRDDLAARFPGLLDGVLASLAATEPA